MKSLVKNFEPLYLNRNTKNGWLNYTSCRNFIWKGKIFLFQFNSFVKEKKFTIYCFLIALVAVMYVCQVYARTHTHLNNNNNIFCLVLQFRHGSNKLSHQICVFKTPQTKRSDEWNQMEHMTYIHFRLVSVSKMFRRMCVTSMSEFIYFFFGYFLFPPCQLFLFLT